MVFFKSFRATGLLKPSVRSTDNKPTKFANNPSEVSSKDKDLEVYLPLVIWAGSPAEWSAMVQEEVGHDC